MELLDEYSQSLFGPKDSIFKRLRLIYSMDLDITR